MAEPVTFWQGWEEGAACRLAATHQALDQITGLDTYGGNIGMEAMMAASDYTHGEMNIDTQTKGFSSFMKAGAWGAILTLLSIGYATLALSVGLPWLVALVLMAGAGIIIGLGMGYGGAWVATIIGLSGLAFFIQVLVILFKMLL